MPNQSQNKSNGSIFDHLDKAAQKKLAQLQDHAMEQRIASGDSITNVAGDYQRTSLLRRMMGGMGGMLGKLSPSTSIENRPFASSLRSGIGLGMQEIAGRRGSANPEMDQTIKALELLIKQQTLQAQNQGAQRSQNVTTEFENPNALPPGTDITRAPGLAVTGGTLSSSPSGVSTSKTFGTSPEQEAAVRVEEGREKDAFTRLDNLDTLDAAIEDLESKLSSVPVGVGSEGRQNALIASLGSFFQGDPYAASSKSFEEGLKTPVAKALGNVGNLSASEQMSARKFIPGLGDSEDTRAMKIIGTYSFAKRILARELRKGKIADRPEVKERLASFDNKLKERVVAAADLGLTPERMYKFLGPQQASELGFVKKYDSFKDALKSKKGDLIVVGNRFYVNE